MGKHRIFCGNSLVAASYERLMGIEKANLVITDPPYNVVIDGHATGNGAIHHREFGMASGEMSSAQFTEFLRKAMIEARNHSLDGSLAYYFMDWRHMTEIFSAGNEVYSELLNLCVWAKSNGGMGSFYRGAHELVFLFKHGAGRHRNNVQLGRFGRNRTNVWKYPGSNTFSRQGADRDLLALHPTPKPVALIVDAIKDCIARGNLVLDPFLGSGTAVIAAERSGRRCYGLELDPIYIDATIRRWQRQTKLEAVHVESGVAFNSKQSARARIMKTNGNPDCYEIGYGKPPKGTQFQKGTSGNPAARPKKTVNFDEALIKEARSLMSVNENGQRKRMSKHKVFIKQLMKEAITGSPQASRIYLGHLRQALEN